MSTILTHIPDVALAQCPECDAALIVSPGQSTTLVHGVGEHAGTHGYDPRAAEQPIDVPDAPDDDVPEPEDDTVPETDPEAEVAAGTEP